MRRKLIISLVGAVVLLGIILVMGPRASLDRQLHPVSLPEDLDSYLANEEKVFQLTSPDVAKQIVWADPALKAKTAVSIIYLHGFSATLKEIDPVTRLLADNFSANVYYVRLSGHGESKERFAKATAGEWMQDTIEAWEIGKRLGQQVVIIGTSTGATLASWLATTQHVPELAALVFVSPNFYPANPTAPVLLWPWGIQLAKLITGGEYRSWKPYSEAQARYWVTEPALTTSAQMMVLVEMVDKLDLSIWQVPTLVLYSELDDVVSVPKIKQKFAAIGSVRKELVEVSNAQNPSKHVLAGDIVGIHTTQFVIDTIKGFLEKNLQ